MGDLLNSRDFQNALLIRLPRTVQASIQAERLIALLDDLDQRLAEVVAE